MSESRDMPVAQAAHPAGWKNAERHELWGVWLTWGLALVLWVNAGDGDILQHPLVSVIAVAVWLAGCGLLVLTLTKGKREMQLLKKKKSPAAPVQDAEASRPVTDAPVSQVTHVPAPGALRDVVVTAIRKDVFIAHGSHLSGQLEAEGNIVTEGSIEGNLRATHQVRVDTGGVVKGDIHAAHIIINGLVTGRCYAGAITLLEQGRIEGNVFTDELAIERGGIFIGQSSPPPASSAPVKDTDTVKGVTPRDERALAAALKKSSVRTAAQDVPAQALSSGEPQADDTPEVKA